MPSIPTISPTTLELVVLALGVITLVSLVVALMALSANSSLRRKMKKWKSIHSSADLEAVYEQTLDAVEKLRADVKQFEEEVTNLRAKIKQKVDTPSIYRYNAFSDVGSDLSYSVALLDENKNGVVLTSIYGREESTTYGKPVQNGTSTYPLTEEESQAIAQVGKSEQKTQLVHT